MAAFDLNDLTRRMDGALAVLGQEFGGLRTGRAAVIAIALLLVLTPDESGAQAPIYSTGFESGRV